MARFRSRLVVDVEPIPNGGWKVTHPDGRTETLTSEQLREGYQDCGLILDWRGDAVTDEPGPGRLYDRDGCQVNAFVIYADVETGLVLARPGDPWERYQSPPIGGIDHSQVESAHYRPPLRFVPSDMTPPPPPGSLDRAPRVG